MKRAVYSLVLSEDVVEAVDRMAYARGTSRSNLINGLSKEVAVEDFTPWWKPALIGVNAALGVLALGAIALFTVSTLKARKKEE